MRTFVKATLVGGVVFLVPVVVLLVLLSKAVGLLRRLAQPLADHLPLDTVAGLVVADALVILLLVVACFLAGLLAHLSFASHFLKRAETGILWRVPGYGFIKALTESIDSRGGSSSGMRPVLIHFDDSAQLAFEIERLADGRCVVFVPSAPEPRGGSVSVMDPQRVEPLPISFAAAVRALRALGRGLGADLDRDL